MKTINRKSISAEEQLALIRQLLEKSRILLYSNLEQNLVKHVLEKNSPVAAPERELIRLKWTSSKINLVELIYSIKKSGVLNHRKADLKTIAQCFEYNFNVDLGNISSFFQEILERKRVYTNITDKLRNVFLKSINNSLND